MKSTYFDFTRKGVLIVEVGVHRPTSEVLHEQYLGSHNRDSMKSIYNTFHRHKPKKQRNLVGVWKLKSYKKRHYGRTINILCNS